MQSSHICECLRIEKKTPTLWIFFIGRYENMCYQMTKTYFGHLQKLPRTQTPPFLQHDTPLDAPGKKMITLQYRGRLKILH